MLLLIGSTAEGAIGSAKRGSFVHMGCVVMHKFICHKLKGQKNFNFFRGLIGILF